MSLTIAMLASDMMSSPGERWPMRPKQAMMAGKPQQIRGRRRRVSAAAPLGGGFFPRFGLLGQKPRQPFAHRVGALRRPFAQTLAGLHAELAGQNHVTEDLRCCGRAVEV